MDYATYAILISVVSLLVSGGSLIWSVKSKFLAPKPKVEIRIGSLHRGGLSGPNTGSALKMVVVNHGPGRVVISDILRSIWVRLPKNGEGSHSLHLNLFTGRDGEPFEGLSESNLPVVLDFADQATFYYADETLMSKPEHFPSVQIGVIDSWGRAHMPNHKELQSVLDNIHRTWIKRHPAVGSVISG